MTEQELAGFAVERIHRLHAEACLAFNREFRKPTVSFDLSGRCAGKAFCLKWEIKLNPVLMRENLQDFLDDTIPHEWAHLVAFEVFKERGHGAWWWWTMGRLNIKSTRCHDYDTSNASRGKCDPKKYA